MLFGVNVSSVVKWSQRRRWTGSAAALPMGGKRGREFEPHRGWLLERLACEPHVTLRGLSAELAERRIPACHVSIFKKSCSPASRIGPPSKRRKSMPAYFAYVCQEVLDRAKLEAYWRAIVPTLEGYGARSLSSYAPFEQLEGEPVEAVVVVEFPSRKARPRVV